MPRKSVLILLHLLPNTQDLVSYLHCCIARPSSQFHSALWLVSSSPSPPWLASPSTPSGSPPSSFRPVGKVQHRPRRDRLPRRYPRRDGECARQRHTNATTLQSVTRVRCQAEHYSADGVWRDGEQLCACVRWRDISASVVVRMKRSPYCSQRS